MDFFKYYNQPLDPDIGFITTDPFFFKKDYDFTIEDSIVESLELQNEKDVKVIVILTPQEPFNRFNSKFAGTSCHKYCE